MRRRVVVTGVGLVTPVGIGVEEVWENVVKGKSGISYITSFDAKDLPVRIAGEVKDFQAEKYIDPRNIESMDRFIQFAVTAALIALKKAGISRFENPERVGVIIGVGLGGLNSIEREFIALREKGIRRVSPYFIPMTIPNLAAGWISILTEAKGVNLCISTACSAGLHAVGEAFRYVREGIIDIAICGGAESAITPLSIAGFANMKALSRRNDEPEKASRPFEKNRDGFVIGEGAGVLILEDYESAKRRGAEIIAEAVGYGANADAYHITAPSPEGKGAEECMRLALKDAGISKENILYINAHGTSTKLNDLYETMAIKRLFGEHSKKLFVSSTKSVTGHTLGAAGGIESVFTALSLKTGILPPTINYEEPDPDCDLNYVPNEAIEVKDIKFALCNSFGFGGTNACVVMKRVE